MNPAAILVLALTLLPGIVFSDTGSHAAPPNIVLIYADDLGYGDVSIYNPHYGKIQTPAIDRLAPEGMRFTDAHSTSGVCTPSRYSLMTGRYHWRSHLQKGIVLYLEPPLIPKDRPTLASMLRDAGYSTAMVGKWHLGMGWDISEEENPFCHPCPTMDTPGSSIIWERIPPNASISGITTPSGWFR